MTEVVEIKIEDDIDDNVVKNNVITEWGNKVVKEEDKEKDNKDVKEEDKEKENKDVKEEEKDGDGYVWSKHRYMTCIKKSLLKFKCEWCDYATTTKSGLRSHMFTHSDDYPFLCPYCSYKGKKHSYLKRHILHKHYNLFNMDMLRTPDEDYYKY